MSITRFVFGKTNILNTNNLHVLTREIILNTNNVHVLIREIFVKINHITKVFSFEISLFYYVSVPVYSNVENKTHFTYFSAAAIFCYEFLRLREKSTAHEK